MKLKKVILALLVSCTAFTGYAKTLRVACVGNSITYGAGIANREKNSYPAQLQYFLGDGYEVRNFGVSGTTLLHKGDYPYIKTRAYAESQSYAPDIVLIKLGTNDSKPQNICHVADFKKEYKALIDTYRNLPSHPRIVMLTPVRCFLPDQTHISEERIRKQLVPILYEIACEEGLEIIDLQRLLGQQWESYLIPDRIHPSSIGAGYVARHIGEVLLTPRAESGTKTGFSGRKFNFYGHRGYDFKLDGKTDCRVVVPEKPAQGMPWVLRARFWGHEPQTDIALLERGFHIAYCDVADLYGSDEAIRRWDAFYNYMKKQGLNKKVVLEGMSRGGLIVYNWAARHPSQVAGIYADAPVMDLKSWPMGQNKGKRSDTDVKQMLKAYGWTLESEALQWKKNPIDHAKKVKNIPILHVVGTTDQVVPVAENTDVFEQRMAACGVKLNVIRKKGVDHHPHSLFNPAPIVRFALRATGLYINPCTHPFCGNEYRIGAGWTEGSEWHSVAQDIVETVQGKQLDWLWLGNSITQGLGGTRKRVTYKPGKAIADKLLGAGRWESAGISGDRTENVLWRVEQGGYDASNPKHVVVSIGINNYFDGDEPTDVAQGIRAVAEAAKRHFPTSSIHVIGLLPGGLKEGDALRTYYNCVRASLNAMKWKGFDYIDATPWFVSPDGNMKEGLYSGDGIHLTAKGYETWCSRLLEHVQKQQR